MRAPSLAPVPVVHSAGRYSGSRGVAFHGHPGAEVVLVVRGRCAIRVGDDRLSAAAGEAFVLPARLPHAQDDDGEVETIYANLTVPIRRFSDRARTLPMPLGGAAAGWLAQLADFQRAALPPTVLGGLALALVEYLAHGERAAANHRALHPGVARAVRRMEDDLLEDLTVADLARAAGLSVSHLTALFNAQLGCPPMAWLQRERLALACRLLRNAYLSVADVAASCGYPDANYFTRLFRQVHGCSPSAWRQRAG
jgi:AraC-like DNA-binding protein